MKKIALTSLLAVFAVSGAHAANVIDGNPLYMPKAGHFYSETSLSSHSEHESAWTLGEEFGYGVTDKLAIAVATELGEAHEFDNMAWGSLKLGATYRALDMGGWKADLYGAYAVDPVWDDHRPFLEEDDTNYTWTAGIRGGYVGSNWTIAGHAAFNYEGLESFDWNKEGYHYVALGLDAQYVICPHFSVLAGVEYLGMLDDNVRGDALKNEGIWTGTLGVNYNIDATKYVGLYVDSEMNHKGGAKHDEWDIQKGFGFGAKFGIDF